MKYILNYGSYKYPEDRREITLSAKNKGEFLIETLNRLGFYPEIISLAVSSKKAAIIKKRTEKDKGNTIINAPQVCLPTKIGRLVQKALMNIWLFFYLAINAKKDEPIIVYHTLRTVNPILTAKKVKRFQLISELEELYSFTSHKPKMLKKEEKMIANADKFIIASRLLYDRIENEGKDYCVFNGNYNCYYENAAFDDNNIHVVYAGLIKTGGLAFKSVEIGKALPLNYRTHIIGYGEKQDVEKLINVINTANENGRRISYDGELRGRELNVFLNKCQIGISPQTFEERFAESCFPSKIATYLSNGLRVVSSKSRAVENSPLGKMIYFVDKDTIEAYVSCIRNVPLQDEYDSREALTGMKNKFENDLSELFEGETNV